MTTSEEPSSRTSSKVGYRGLLPSQRFAAARRCLSRAFGDLKWDHLLEEGGSRPLFARPMTWRSGDQLVHAMINCHHRGAARTPASSPPTTIPPARLQPPEIRSEDQSPPAGLKETPTCKSERKRRRCRRSRGYSGLTISITASSPANKKTKEDADQAERRHT